VDVAPVGLHGVKRIACNARCRQSEYTNPKQY
jgi:hypothetical protein